MGNTVNIMVSITKRGMRFHRHFVSHEEVITKLEEYLKQLQAEAKGVEERITEVKKKGESPPT